MDEEKLQPGKLPLPLLEVLLKEHAWTGESVIVGPAIGEDAAVVKVDEKLIVLTSDPITFVADDMGLWSLAINANDIAVMGAVPKWFLATVLLPEGEATESMAKQIVGGLGERCKRVGISLCGGHTEITDAVTRPVICGHMVGEVGPSGIIKSSGARPGNLLILTKGIAIEGTAVLAREAGARLSRLGEKFCRTASSFVLDPGISIVQEATIAASFEGVTAMHDPTEGGLSTALYELAKASKTGVEIYPEAVHIYPETELICDELGIDPMGLLASGALLVAVEGEGAKPLCERMRGEGIDATVIGRITGETGNLVVIEGESRKSLKRFERDEVAKALYS
ncbi:MAG: AIR synthase family protein [Candidatus Glassbacteria bacterium]